LFFSSVSMYVVGNCGICKFFCCIFKCWFLFRFVFVSFDCVKISIFFVFADLIVTMLCIFAYRFSCFLDLIGDFSMAIFWFFSQLAIQHSLNIYSQLQLELHFILRFVFVFLFCCCVLREMVPLCVSAASSSIMLTLRYASMCGCVQSLCCLFISLFLPFASVCVCACEFWCVYVCVCFFVICFCVYIYYILYV